MTDSQIPTHVQGASITRRRLLGVTLLGCGGAALVGILGLAVKETRSIVSGIVANKEDEKIMDDLNRLLTRLDDENPAGKKFDAAMLDFYRDKKAKETIRTEFSGRIETSDIETALDLTDKLLNSETDKAKQARHYDDRVKSLGEYAVGYNGLSGVIPPGEYISRMVGSPN